MLKNQNPEQSKTHERQQGGNTSTVGEVHDSKKAKTIPENRRWDADAQKVETP